MYIREQALAKILRLKNSRVTGGLLAFAEPSFAVVFDMREGVTDMSKRIQALHHLSLWVCIIVGVIVFGAVPTIIKMVLSHVVRPYGTSKSFFENTFLL